VADIVSATREINAATRQIAGNMATVSALADSGSATARETAQAGQVLGDVAVQLNGALKAFSY
jgi:methyl-accepting chemotaxis protein